MPPLDPPCLWLNAQAVRRNIRLVLFRQAVDAAEAASWVRSDLAISIRPATPAQSLRADNDS